MKEENKLELQQESIFKVNTKTLYEVVNYLSSFHTDIKLKLSQEGLYIISKDSANVCMNEVCLNQNAFLKCSGELDLNINLKLLKDALINNKKSDVTITKDGGNYIVLNFDNGFKSIIPLIEIEDWNQKIPDLNYLGTSDVEQKHFKQMVLNMKKVSETVLITSGLDKKLKFTSKSDLNTSEIQTDYLFNSDSLNVKYSLEYLKSFCKQLFYGDLSLSMNSDYPLKAVYTNRELKLTFILAPRINND